MSKDQNDSDLSFDSAVARTHLQTWFPKLDSDKIEKLLEFQGEILKQSQILSLGSAQVSKSFELFHIADAILAFDVIRSHLISNAPLYDLGTGVGLPGIVFAVLSPQEKFVLVDQDEKKMAFCQALTGKLNLSNVTAVRADIETLPELSVQNAVCRGLGPLSKSLILARRPMSKGGKLFQLKNESWATELSQLQPQLLTAWESSLLGQYELPTGKGSMSVVLTVKT